MAEGESGEGVERGGGVGEGGEGEVGEDEEEGVGCCLGGL